MESQRGVWMESQRGACRWRIRGESVGATGWRVRGESVGVGSEVSLGATGGGSQVSLGVKGWRVTGESGVDGQQGVCG